MRLEYTDPEARNYHVFFNGRQIFDCVETDEEAGRVVRHRRGSRPDQLHRRYAQHGVVSLVRKPELVLLEEFVSLAQAVPLDPMPTAMQLWKQRRKRRLLSLPETRSAEPL